MKQLKYLKYMPLHPRKGERKVQSEKPASGLATSNLMMSRAEVERRGGADVNSGHNLQIK
jgi:hypothetical protein